MQAKLPIQQIVHHLQDRAVETASDGEVLRHFIEQPEEATFATLVHRHGTMVFHVCRRVLSNAHDIEDAFQATFLVLVQKAQQLQHRETVGDWLHGVALHTALKARAMIRKRRAKERSAAKPDAILPMNDSDTWQKILLDEEIRRLPERYRLAVLHCDLQRRSRSQAAQTLGWREGTVASRLARGRIILCKRLKARGVEITSLLLIAEMTGVTHAAILPTPWIDAVTEAACKLTHGESVQAAASLKVVVLMKSGLVAALNHKASVAVVFLVCAVAITGWGLVIQVSAEGRRCFDGCEHDHQSSNRRSHFLTVETTPC